MEKISVNESYQIKKGICKGMIGKVGIVNQNEIGLLIDCYTLIMTPRDNVEPSFVCLDCVYKDYHDDGEIGCSHPYLYDKEGELIEKRNERIASNMTTNKCDKKEVKR